MQAKEEWTAGLRITVNTRNCTITNKVGQIASLMDFDVVFPQVVATHSGFVRKVIQTPAAKTPEMIIATLERAELRQPPEMPFADHGGLVSGRLQQFWKSGLSAVELVAGSIVVKAVGVTVLAGEHCSAAWPANRIGNQAAIEPHSLPGQPVDVGRANEPPRVAISADGLVTVIMKAESRREIVTFCESLRHILMAVSWGGHESLVIPRCASLTDAAFDKHNSEHKMIRFYFGLEDPEYLIGDLQFAFGKI